MTPTSPTLPTPKDRVAAERQLLFVADQGSPRLGMERALEELLSELGRRAPVEVLYLFSDTATDTAYDTCALGLDESLVGRLRGLGRLRRAVRDRPDATLVAVGIWAAITTAIATTGLRRRIVLWEHSVLPWRLRHERTLALGAGLLRLFAHRIASVVAVSDATARCARTLVWPLRPVSSIPNLVHADDHVPTTAVSEGCVRLLGVGSLNHRKNWRLAVEALVHLPATYSLAIAGAGADHGMLTELATRLGVADRVELLGYVTDMPREYRACTVVVHPSYAETFGYSLMEAAEHRRPVVALARPVMDEFIPGLVPGAVTEATAEAYAAAIGAAVRTAHDFDGAASRRAEAFEPGRVVERWLSALPRPRGVDAGATSTADPERRFGERVAS